MIKYLQQALMVLSVSSLLIAGGYWMGRSDEAENTASPVYEKGFADGRLYENQTYGKDFITKIQERVDADFGAGKKKKRKYDTRALNNLMDKVGG
jgi:hypothetical protein